MQINCKNCDTLTSIDTEVDIKQFGCSNCGNFYSIGEIQKLDRKFEYKSIDHILLVGKKGIFDGVEYEIINRLVKKFHTIYYWREYTLKSKEGKYLYLSESDGHWILLEEITEGFKPIRKDTTLIYNQIKYDLFEKSNCNIVSAAGFFDYSVPNSNVQITEYINPPNIISIEKNQNIDSVYFGKHFSKTELKKAFGNSNFPSKIGVGAIQPFMLNFSNTAIIFCVVAIFILVTQIFFNQDRTQKQILSKTFSFAEYDKKDFVSESFSLNGGSAPMTISLSSDVDNSWANAQIALINENTNEEISANKDIEYYRGYTDGENWSEGSQGEQFNICGVGEGKYHLVITPQKQPDDITNNALRVDVVWRESSLWNLFISILIMGGVLVIIFFSNKYFEQKRWESSDYSPFQN